MVKRVMRIDNWLSAAIPRVGAGARVARNASRPEVAVASEAHSGDRSPNRSGNRDGSLPLRSVDTQDSNDIPKNGATRERTNKMSKPAASSAEIPDNQSAGGTVSPPAGRASRSGAA
jgi:hypothetical protein